MTGGTTTPVSCTYVVPFRRTAADIATLQGIPAGTVRSRLHYATQAMRAALHADAREPAVAENGTA